MALGKLYALCKLSPSVITFIRQSILHAFDEEDLECLEQKNFRAVEQGTERGQLLSCVTHILVRVLHMP